MEDKLYQIIKLAYDRHGKSHFLTLASMGYLHKYLKVANPVVDDILKQDIMIDIDQLESLFNPEKFDFEKQKIKPISLKLS